MISKNLITTTTIIITIWARHVIIYIHIYIYIHTHIYIYVYIYVYIYMACDLIFQQNFVENMITLIPHIWKLRLRKIG